MSDDIEGALPFIVLVSWIAIACWARLRRKRSPADAGFPRKQSIVVLAMDGVVAAYSLLSLGERMSASGAPTQLAVLTTAVQVLTLAALVVNRLLIRYTRNLESLAVTSQRLFVGLVDTNRRNLELSRTLSRLIKVPDSRPDVDFLEIAAALRDLETRAAELAGQFGTPSRSRPDGNRSDRA